MRYDMKYKKLNVEDNESCNLQCEKKCEKLAGVFICCILAFFLLFLSTRNVGLIYCYADELSDGIVENEIGNLLDISDWIGHATGPEGVGNVVEPAAQL